MPTRPIPFTGSAEEREANRQSHRWSGIDGACWVCDAKPWHVAADYPCMAEVPREIFEVPGGPSE